MADDVQYEFKAVQAIRGTEARSIAKWHKAGWEFVDQNQGTLRTTLNFRRPKRKVPWVLIAVAAGVVLLLAIVGGIASAFQGGDDEEAKATKSPSESTAVASEKPSEGPMSEDSKSGESNADPALTVANSRQFAALLRMGDPCAASVGRFADEYEGKTIEFNGTIVNMTNHGDYDTRYDVLLGPGDKGPKTAVGPQFKFENVNVFDLSLTGANKPAHVGAGDRVHVVAEVGEFNPDQCLFFLEPVSTEVR
jgi:hypothetical protein